MFSSVVLILLTLLSCTGMLILALLAARYALVREATVAQPLHLIKSLHGSLVFFLFFFLSTGPLDLGGQKNSSECFLSRLYLCAFSVLHLQLTCVWHSLQYMRSRKPSKLKPPVPATAWNTTSSTLITPDLATCVKLNTVTSNLSPDFRDNAITCASNIPKLSAHMCTYVHGM